MSIQNIRCLNANSPSGTEYCTPSGTQSGWGAETTFRSVIRGGGKLKSGGKFSVVTAPGVGNSRTLTVRINGSSSSYAITISGTNTEGTYNGSDINISDGDLISIQHTQTGTPTASGAVKLTIPYEPTTNKESIYPILAGGSNSGTALRYTGLFNSRGFDTIANCVEVIPTSGDITGLGVVASAAITAGNGMHVYINLNGVRQDGSGGTVNTLCDFTTGTVSVTSNFTLPVVAGDLVYLEWEVVGSFTTRNWGVGSRFKSQLPGYSPVIGKSNALSNSADRFAAPVLTLTVNTLESDATSTFFGGIGNSKFKSLYVYHSAAPGVGKSYTTQFRLSQGSTVLSATVSDNNTTGNNTSDEVSATNSTPIGLKFTPTGTPTASQVSWGLVEITSSGGNGNSNKGGNGPKGVGGKQIFGPAGMLFWDSINGFGQ